MYSPVNELYKIIFSYKNNKMDIWKIIKSDKVAVLEKKKILSLKNCRSTFSNYLRFDLEILIWYSWRYKFSKNAKKIDFLNVSHWYSPLMQKIEYKNLIRKTWIEETLRLISYSLRIQSASQPSELSRLGLWGSLASDFFASLSFRNILVETRVTLFQRRVKSTHFQLLWCTWCVREFGNRFLCIGSELMYRGFDNTWYCCRMKQRDQCRPRDRSLWFRYARIIRNSKNLRVSRCFYLGSRCRLRLFRSRRFGSDKFYYTVL